MEQVELQLQARWYAGEFGHCFVTTEGLPVRVVHFGLWNREAGPDFVHAALSFNGEPPVNGAIELDLDVRDWERHGHATNPEYEQVLLHLFVRGTEKTFFTRTVGNRKVAQVQLDPGKPVEPTAPLLARCAAPLSQLSAKKASELLQGAARFRLRKKSGRLAVLASHHGSDEALFQALAAALGYKANKLPFTVLAQRLPLRTLLLQKQEAEALLLGVAGFLDATEWSRFDGETRIHLRGLWEHWWAHRTGFGRLILEKNRWRISGCRPANHPQRRVAALAELVRHWPKLRSLARSCEVEKLERFFAELGNGFWSRHYTLKATSPKPMALIGKARVADMLSNVFFPFALLEHPGFWENYLLLSAPQVSHAVKTAATRLFGGHRPELMRSLAHQQGLLQIYDEFCLQEQTGCGGRLFPEQLLQWGHCR